MLKGVMSGLPSGGVKPHIPAYTLYVWSLMPLGITPPEGNPDVNISNAYYKY